MIFLYVEISIKTFNCLSKITGIKHVLQFNSNRHKETKILVLSRILSQFLSYWFILIVQYSNEYCNTCTCNFIFPLIGCSYSKVYTVKGQNLTTGKLKIIMLSFKSYSIQTFKFCSIFYWEYHRNKMLCLFGSKDNLFVFAWTNADQTPYTEPVSSDEVR